LVSQLRANINSLEDLLRLSRHTIQTLQGKLNDVENSTQTKIDAQDSQLRYLTKSLEDANTMLQEAGMQTGVSIGTGQQTGYGYGNGYGNGYANNNMGGQAQAPPVHYPMPTIDREKIRRLMEETRLEGQKRAGRVALPPLYIPDSNSDQNQTGTYLHPSEPAVLEEMGSYGYDNKPAVLEGMGSHGQDNKPAVLQEMGSHGYDNKPGILEEMGSHGQDNKPGILEEMGSHGQNDQPSGKRLSAIKIHDDDAHDYIADYIGEGKAIVRR
jgi:cytokinesis protein